MTPCHPYLRLPNNGLSQLAYVIGIIPLWNCRSEFLKVQNAVRLNGQTVRRKTVAYLQVMVHAMRSKPPGKAWVGNLVSEFITKNGFLDLYHYFFLLLRPWQQSYEVKRGEMQRRRRKLGFIANCFLQPLVPYQQYHRVRFMAHLSWGSPAAASSCLMALMVYVAPTQQPSAMRTKRDHLQ